MGTIDTSNPEFGADQKADRRAFLLIVGVAILSFAVQVITQTLDGERYGTGVPFAEIIVNEATSHLIIVALAYFIPSTFRLGPLSADLLVRSTVFLTGLFLLFALIHVVAMYGLRLLLYPVTLGQPYSLDLLEPQNMFYEASKDSVVFTMLVSIYLVSRFAQQRHLENVQSGQTARTQHRITLKSSGTTIFLPANEILWAKAASNYVEVHTPSRTHFARATLKSLHSMLQESGSDHVRVHRSYVVSRKAISEIIPTGEGDVRIKLLNGDTIPGSRRYRDAIEPAS